MFEPGYYKTNYRAWRFREMVRWYGWPRGVRIWLRTRFMRPTRHGTWMPRLWVESECKPEQLSEDFWRDTKPHRADFEKLGFVQCRLGRATKKSDKISNPNILDSGGIFYLDPTRCYFGQLIYSRQIDPAKGKVFNHIVLVFTAVFEQESFSCTNARITYDSPNPGKIIRLNSYDVPEIYKRFREELQRRPDTPRPFPDVESLRRWFDTRQLRNFEDRVRRRLFIRMTEPEAAAYWAERQRYPAGRPPTRRRRFRLNLVTTTFVLIGVISTLMVLHRQNAASIAANNVPSNTIDYQGQHFKMSRAYTDYDDYKDDPNNLDTNELGRIEQAMEAVKIPASFKDRKTLVSFMVELEFPGYGLSDGGGQTDDGSTLEVDSVEIPQANKERVMVGQSESDGSWKIVDDFIYSGSDTNDISRVHLEHRQLEYYDRAGRLVRKKTLEK